MKPKEKNAVQKRVKTETKQRLIRKKNILMDRARLNKIYKSKKKKSC